MLYDTGVTDYWLWLLVGLQNSIFVLRGIFIFRDIFVFSDNFIFNEIFKFRDTFIFSEIFILRETFSHSLKSLHSEIFFYLETDIFIFRDIFILRKGLIFRALLIQRLFIFREKYLYQETLFTKAIVKFEEMVENHGGTFLKYTCRTSKAFSKKADQRGYSVENLLVPATTERNSTADIVSRISGILKTRKAEE